MSFEPSATQSYAYMDNSSKLSGWNTLGRAESFGYDKDTGRLSESSEATYTFGGSSALPLKQPLTQALSDYTFNAKGQRTKVHAGSQPATLTWQGERLLSLETSNTRANYAYDASGMRIKADLTGAHGASQTLRYTYDGLRLLEVSSKSSTDTSNFSIGYLYEADNQTPSAASYETRLLTNATECIDETLAYAIAHNQPLRYAGYVYDDYSQMYYCAARYYDPATQVFVSLDPARADGERSGYLYCEGDPVNSVDPSGSYLRKAAKNGWLFFKVKRIIAKSYNLRNKHALRAFNNDLRSHSAAIESFFGTTNSKKISYWSKINYGKGTQEYKKWLWTKYAWELTYFGAGIVW